MKVMWLLACAAATQAREHALLRSGSSAGPFRFLLMSSTTRGVVEYMQLPSGVVRPLVDTGLVHPKGIAVNGTTLYVADTGTRRIEAFELRVLPGETPHLMAHRYRTVATDVGAEAVAVGKEVFFTDEAAKLVEAVGSDGEVRILYNGEEVPAAFAPGGLAIDGIEGLIWANKLGGHAQGSLVGADFITKATRVVAGDTESTYGVCLSHTNIFYSAKDAAVYGVKRTGGGSVEVNGAMGEPRGCVYDNDGTVYFADQKLNKIFTLPANMATLGPEEVAEFATVQSPFGLALLSWDPAQHVKPSLLARFTEWWNEQ